MNKTQEYLKQIGERVAYQGKLFEVVQRKMAFRHGGKTGGFKMETVRRPPGVRLLIVKNKRILLAKEYRAELNSWDYRLPGGKVFNTLAEYHQYAINSTQLKKYVEKAIKNEALEEVGIKVKKMKFIAKDVLGATCYWDLYYYQVIDFDYSPHGQQTSSGEIIYPKWYNFKQVKKLCLTGKISESRSRAVIFQFLLK